MAKGFKPVEEEPKQPGEDTRVFKIHRNEGENLADFELAHAEFDTEQAEKVDEQRLKLYQKHWDYYDGNMKKFLKTKTGKPDDNVILNLCAVLIDRTTSRLFGDATRGEMLSFDVETREEVSAEYVSQSEGIRQQEDRNQQLEAQAHAFIYDVFERSGGLETVFNSTGVYGGVTGHFVFKIVVGEEGPRIVVMDPGLVSVLTAEDDKDEVRAYKIEYQILRRDPTDPNERIKEATFRQLVLNGKYYDGLEGEWYIQDFITFKKRVDPEWIPDSEIDIWDFSPIIDGQNLPHARDYFGMSDLHNVTELNDEMNFILSNANRIIRFHAHPRTIGIGVDPDTIQETNVESFWAVSATPDEANIYNLEMDSDLQSTFNFFNIIRETFWTIGREADPTVFKDKIGNVTNFGLRVLYLDALNKLGQKRQTYGKAFTKLGERLMSLAEESYDELTLVPKWHDPLPTDPREQVETMMMEADMGILSKETAARMRGRNWFEERKRIMDEQKEEQDFGQKFLANLRGEGPNSGSLRQFEGSKGGNPDLETSETG